MRLSVLLFAVLCVGALLYIRLAPSDPARWHTDPVTAPDPDDGGVRVEPGRVVSARAPRDLLAAFDKAALAEPRAKRLAGSLDAGRITYVFRSRGFGFPDYLTVQALPHEGGSTLAVLSRLRFGLSDTGVNAARLDRMLERLGADMLIRR